MPISTVSAVIVKLQAHAITAGAKEAPALPTEGNIGTPISQCYLRMADIISRPGPAEKDLVTVFMDVHFSRIDLPYDVAKVMAFYELFKPLLIADPTLGGTVDTLQMTEGTTPIHVEFGEMTFSGQKTIGLRWSIKFKMET